MAKEDKLKALSEAKRIASKYIFGIVLLLIQIFIDIIAFSQKTLSFFTFPLPQNPSHIVMPQSPEINVSPTLLL